MKRLRILTPRTLLALAAACGAAYVILFVVAASTRAQKAACGPAQAQTVVNIGIGTQDTTTNTVTAGVVIRQLKLLENYLPKDGK